MYQPSINIIRDNEKAFDYLVTPNSERVYSIIKDNFLFGNRAFSLIGTFGTGKSSFLLALEKHLKGETNFFEGGFSKDTFDSHKIIGHYSSLITAVGNSLGISDPSESSIIEYLEYSKGENIRLIIIDEFGKFLEYAAQNNPEKELYFVQLLAEYVSKPENKALMLITLHQGFDAYASTLDKKQQNEWEKVKGRLTEIPFNEPVEQLVFIASKRIPSLLNGKEITPKKDAPDIYKLVKENFILPMQIANTNESKLNKNLFPLDIASAGVLALALQKYGQNERSLFSFLESANYLGFQDFLSKRTSHPFDLVEVYDYLSFNFYSNIYSRFNPDLFRWNLIKESIARAEAQLPSELEDVACSILKVIGLLNIFSSKAANINEHFIQQYLGRRYSINLIKKCIETLEEEKVIRFRKYKDSFVLFEGSDTDIEKVLEEARKETELPKDLVPRLVEYFNLSPISAKKYYFKNGTPRYFKFILSDEPVQSIKPSDSDYDGYINLLFDEEIVPNAIEEAILYGKFPNIPTLRELIREIDVTTKAITHVKGLNDPKAQVEIEILKADLIEKLNEELSFRIFHRPNEITWFFKGQEVQSIDSTSDLNKFLSIICETIYHSTPKFVNELVNRNKFSSTVSTARKKLIKAILENQSIEDLGFPSKKFPAEKGIYLSLIKDNLHVQLDNKSWGFAAKPKQQSFHPLWESGEAFLSKAQNQILPIQDLVDLWRAKPFRLKKGFIDFWLPIFLFLKKEEFTLYNEKQHLVPSLNEDVLELVVLKPSKFYLKSFALAGQRLNIFNKYRELTSLSSEGKISQSGFIETVKPFLVFYRDLPYYTQNTKNLSAATQRFRTALIKAKDPEKVFFEDFPTSLGFSFQDLEDEEKLQLYASQVREAIRELREAYPNLLGRIESEILRLRGIEENTSFEKYREILNSQYAAVKRHLLTAKQKSFYSRLLAPMDQMQDWIAALGQVVLNKGLDKLKDAEEKYFLEKLGDMFRALDNTKEFAIFDSIKKEEEVLKVELTSLKNGFDHKVFSNIAKINPKKAKRIKEDVKERLSGKKDVDIAVLSELLKELLSENEQD